MALLGRNWPEVATAAFVSERPTGGSPTYTPPGYMSLPCKLGRLLVSLGTLK